MLLLLVWFLCSCSCSCPCSDCSACSYQKNGGDESETEMAATALAFSEKFGVAGDAAVSTKTSDFR